MQYEKILAPLDAFDETVRRFQSEGGKGLNITVPFKVEACRLADELTPRSRAAGAVNTFVFRNDGTIFGDNTDGCGIVRDIACNLGHGFSGKRVLLLGAGGAVRGTLLPIIAEQPAAVMIANRTAARALELAQQFREQAGEVRLKGGGFADIEGGFDIIINGTTTSLLSEVPPLPPGIWAPDALAYDMYYKNEPTAFMLTALDAGARHAADGLGMLVEQGAESFYLWRGMRPDTAPVIVSLRN